MNKVWMLLSLVILITCHSDKPINAKVGTTRKVMYDVNKKNAETKDASTDNEIAEQTSPFYVVVADTSLNYDVLHQKMFAINKILNIEIDTLGRFYNRKKNLIQLPDNDPDEIYAGDYFLRRGEGKSLSIEYLNAYKKSSNEKMMALLSGIYEKKSSADSALAILKETSVNSFVFKADIYMGCIH